MDKHNIEESFKDHIRRVLEEAEPSLLPEEILQLGDAVESSLASYAQRLKEDQKEERGNQERINELKSHRQKTLEESISIAVRSVKDTAQKESPHLRAEKWLRNHLKAVLDSENFGLTDDEKRRIEDRVIRLLGDYAQTSEFDRPRVYEAGEQEILSILNPKMKPRTASASGSA